MTELSKRQRRWLEKEGYLLLPGLLNAADLQATIDTLEHLWQKEGQQAGAENYIEKGVRRLANLYNKNDHFAALYAHPLVLAAGEVVVGDGLRLSMLNARDVPPHAEVTQPLHADVDDAQKPDDGYFAFTAVWMLDSFTAENGASRLVPGSHLSTDLPEEKLDDLLAPHPDEVIVEGQAGDVLVFNGHCWHSGRANRTDGHRRAVLAHYIRAGYPNRLDPAHDIDPAIAEGLNPTQRRLLGLEGGAADA